MPVSSRSYGSASNVAALVPKFASNNAFDSSTRPTLTQVENWINEYSAVVNTLLAEQGFTIPVSQADGVLMLGALVESAVADCAEYANRTGRFFSDAASERGLSISKILRSEIAAWINDHAKGFENLGVARSTESSFDIAYRESDQSGDAVPPLFERKAFGNVDQDWDTP